jgi:hypothetical protein
MRHMSFSLTTEQVKNKTKTITRRLGWDNLKIGELVQAVEKAQGLKKGEKVKKIHVIRIVSTHPEPLRALTDNLDYGFTETAKEGFPEGHRYFWPSVFVEFFCKTHKHCTPDTPINRIEFEYVVTATREDM